MLCLRPQAPGSLIQQLRILSSLMIVMISGARRAGGQMDGAKYWRGIEPGPSARQAEILTTMLSRI